MARRNRRPRPAGRGARDSLRRGIYILPSLFTVGNMLCGFAAVLHALQGRLALAGMLILLANLLDALDGRIARLTNSTSEFGKEYDSLADVVSFGVAPAILVYQWCLSILGRWGWAVAFLFLVAGSVRLARFNVKAHTGDRRFFTGLPIPAGAGALTLMVLLDPAPIFDKHLAIFVWGFVFLVSILMVSTVPYRSFKDYNLRQRWPATAFFMIALVAAFMTVAWWEALALILATYIVSGPAEYVARRLRRAPLPLAVPPEPDAPHADSEPAQPDHP